MPDEPEEDDPVVLMYTGGTTGLPKGVLLDQRAEMLNLYHVALAVGARRATSVYLHQTPMFHAASMGGILGVPAPAGTSVFVPLFDPGKVMDVDRASTASTMDGDGADDDRHGAEPPRLPPERLASLTTLDLRRVADAGGAARAAAASCSRTSTSARATA